MRVKLDEIQFVLYIYAVNLSPDCIQMSISPRHTPRKLLHYSCVNGNQLANEHQKVVTAKRGSKMYNLEETRA